MKLIGLMCVRNEDWCFEASLRAALRWCDEVVVVDHASGDRTYDIWNAVSGENPRRIWYSRWDEGKKWDEMDMREHSLLLARKHRGTHVAIIDADEILTANLVDRIRNEFESLEPKTQLEVPMLAMRSLDKYQNDDSVWARAWLTLGFADHPDLTWKPAEDTYQHHHRSPYGIVDTRRFLSDKSSGGVMHIQFANRRRLVAKHWLYAYTDHLRWPDRENVAELSFKYSQALQPTGPLESVPREWWSGYAKEKIRTSGLPWQEIALIELLKDHGEEAFKGIQLSERRPV